MRKIIVVCVLFCSIALPIYSQIDIRGDWQFGSHLASNCRSFYGIQDDSVFVYTSDKYDELSIPVWIKGKYSIIGDSIFFTVKYVEIKSFRGVGRRKKDDDNTMFIEYYWDSDSTAAKRTRPSKSNLWYCIGGKIETIELEKTSIWSASFRYYVEDNKYPVIEIDGDKYYYIFPPE